MINITDKEKCCGCSACAQVCPKNCISFYEDAHGFAYPYVNKSDCIDCGLCERVCSFLIKTTPRTPLKCYAARNSNQEIRMKSSSGGLFTALAEQILAEGGVVFGASFDISWNVIHSYTETIEGLQSFRGSKYVQSRMENTFRQVLSFLKQGRKVLFSGTSCQILGLKNFLRKDYAELLTVEVICHGVPSPLMWRDYLKEILSKHARVNNVNNSTIDSILFRDKSFGWKKFRFIVSGAVCDHLNDGFNSRYDVKTDIVNERAWDNKYLRSFFLNYSLRPSCFHCPAKCGRSKSDIALADFWGVYKAAPELDDDKGVSLALVYSEAGLNLLNKVNDKLEISYEQALEGNYVVERPVKVPKNYNLFWKLYNNNGYEAIQDLIKKKKQTLFSLVKNKIKYEINKLL